MAISLFVLSLALSLTVCVGVTAVATSISAQPASPILNGEKLIGLAAAAKLFPGHRGGDSLDTSTLFR